MAQQRQTFTDKCIRDEDGNMVLGQKPNGLQLAGWLALLMSWPLAGKPGHVAAMIAYGAWFGWAWLELFQGVNYFRRFLGTAVLAVLLVLSFHSG